MFQPPLSSLPTPAASLRAAAFIGRCALAATLAYRLALLVGLSNPVWASVSALIVSQERLHDTRLSLRDRIRGTLAGVLASVAVHALLAPLGADVAVQLALAVAICAAIARQWRNLRVCMWTCPAVLLTGPGETVLAAGASRAAEIVLGCLVGAACHLLAELLVDRGARRG
jgi:uncharacterized membrane protein YccC